MRVLIAAAALSAAFVLMPAATGDAPAWSQDFSITNPSKPVDASHRDLIRQLQAWWDVQAYYPRRASLHDEGGTVGVHIIILRDGRILSVQLIESSDSEALDAAAVKTFTGGYVRPLPEGAAETGLDISVHYVLAHRHDQPVPAGYKPEPAKGPFTINNDPVTSPILEKMLQKTCTGTLKIKGLRNHPIRGIFYSAKAVFFRRPDGKPWVQFWEGSRMVYSPVIQVGKLVSWTGPNVFSGRNNSDISGSRDYMAWLEDDNKLNGCISSNEDWGKNAGCEDAPGTLELSCADDVVPEIEWNARYAVPGSRSWDRP